VELLMNMTSECSLLVGLTVLAAAHPNTLGTTHATLPCEICDRQLGANDSEATAADLPQGEHILNESDVSTLSQSWNAEHSNAIQNFDVRETCAV